MNQLLSDLFRVVSFLVLGLIANPTWADVVTYFHNDISGTPLAATDEGGNLLWKESYRPYGERLLNAAGPGANRLWFTGKPQDPDTGLSYLGARYYNPQLGRFTGIDPKAADPEDFHSFNRYAYANNNPYKFVDPDGRNPLLLVAVGLGLWLGTEVLTPMPDVPPGSGMVVPTSFPDLTGALGAAKGLGVAAMAIRSVEKAAAKEGIEAVPKGLTIGGGGTLDKLSPSEINRIQNAANRSGIDIGVVGSRVNPNKALHSKSDYDFVIDANSKTRNNLSRSLPGSKNVNEGVPSNQDIFKGTVDTNKPHVIFHPE